jgi:NhaA family Na+:H+ antiporter
VLVWLAFLKSGVHATIAGVMIALTIPARYRIDAATFHQQAHELLHSFDPLAGPATRMLTDDGQQRAILALEDFCEQVQAPLQKLEHRLQGWVTWLIMPLFALANAGINLSAVRLDAGGLPLALGIIIGLVLGKPIGLLGTSWLAVRSGLAVLPQGVAWKTMLGAGLLAGIGFTMSIFIATLAFDTLETLATVKLAILVASLVAGTLGVLLLRSLPAAE